MGANGWLAIRSHHAAVKREPTIPRISLRRSVGKMMARRLSEAGWLPPYGRNRQDDGLPIFGRWLAAALRPHYVSRRQYLVKMRSKGNEVHRQLLFRLCYQIWHRHLA